MTLEVSKEGSLIAFYLCELVDLYSHKKYSLSDLDFLCNIIDGLPEKKLTCTINFGVYLPCSWYICTKTSCNWCSFIFLPMNYMAGWLAEYFMTLYCDWRPNQILFRLLFFHISMLVFLISPWPWRKSTCFKGRAVYLLSNLCLS